MKILLIGSGAREHAIYDALLKSEKELQIIVFSKTNNPAMISSFAYEQGNIEDLSLAKKIAQKHKPDLAIIGPDNPIGLGMADVFTQLKIPTFAPSKSLARLESSKSFTRNLLAKYNIVGNPQFKVFTTESSPDDIASFMKNDLKGEYVVKYDALLGGKGVKLSQEHLLTIEEGVQFAQECINEAGKVVIEEKFIGPEFSLICFADGISIAPTPLVHDHKRAFNGDIGPNTGGMGTFTDANHLLPFITEKDRQEALEITRKVQDALKLETGEFYCGIMYGGFIKTASGIRLIEFNARFGDPEAMNILPLLKTDFLTIILACINQTLNQIKIEFLPQASVCLYIVPESYPDGPSLPEEDSFIKVTKTDPDPNLHLFFASVDIVKENETEFLLKMSSSRALAFTAKAPSIEKARQKALKALEAVSGKISFRTDIGSEFLIQKRIDLVKSFK